MEERRDRYPSINALLCVLNLLYRTSSQLATTVLYYVQLNLTAHNQQCYIVIALHIQYFEIIFLLKTAFMQSQRLSELLKSEDEMYIEELSNMKETPLERQARMRERARVLKEAREKERLAFVEEKLEQKWRQKDG